MMQVLIPFFMFFIIVSIFRIVLINAGRSYNKDIKEELERDRLANFSRKKDIPENIFYLPNLEDLPIKDYPIDDTFNSVISAQEKVLQKGNLKMLRLSPPLSNIEIKENFGYANLELIIRYEENYYAYIHALNNFASSLIKIDDEQSAENVLLNCILKMESNVLKTYSLLFQIYMDKNDKAGLKDIFERIGSIESLNFDEELKEKIQNQFNNISNSL